MLCSDIAGTSQVSVHSVIVCDLPVAGVFEDVEFDEFHPFLVLFNDLAERGIQPEAPGALLMPEMDDCQFCGLRKFSIPSEGIHILSSFHAFSLPHCFAQQEYCLN